MQYYILCLCYLVSALEDIDVFPTEACDMENWMTELPSRLKELPLMYLAIPGSHDSMSYGINASSEIAPDFPVLLKPLWLAFKATVLGWVRTQDLTVNQQLQIGIRYFDLRVATKKNTDKYYFTHGLYAEEITGPLHQIKSFIISHPQEVVILDFQKFHDFTNNDHRILVGTILVDIFHDRLCWQQRSIKNVTLKHLTDSLQTVIIIYRFDYHVMYQYWTSPEWPTYWPNTDNVDQLLPFLRNVTKHRDPYVGFVHQAVLTMQYATISTCGSDILNCFAKPVQQKHIPILQKLKPGPPPDGTLNVVIADYVNLSPGNNELFPKAIVQLNYKLLLDSPKAPVEKEKSRRIGDARHS